MKKVMLVVVSLVMFVAASEPCGCRSEPKKYPYMNGPMKVYWEEYGAGAYKGIVQLPGGQCYFRDVRAGGVFAADKVSMTEMECPEEPE